MHTSKTLQHDLLDMGLDGGETVMIHSSMKSIGKTDGNADAVLNAICDFFAQGLVVFPSFTYTYISMGASKIFYEKTTPSCIGLLPELFRLRPGVRRSLHPQHAVTALGKDADDFVRGHEKCLSSFCISGPFGKLIERNAKILMIGVNLTRASVMHGFLEWANSPVLTKEPLEFAAVDRDGNSHDVTVYYHLGVQWDNFNRILDDMLSANAVKKVKFGDADSLLMDCRMAFEVVKSKLAEKPDLFFNPQCPPSIQVPGLTAEELKQLKM